MVGVIAFLDNENSWIYEYLLPGGIILLYTVFWLCWIGVLWALLVIDVAEESISVRILGLITWFALIASLGILFAWMMFDFVTLGTEW